jgi:murein DD-endopeptidase MepM/ murein hydrolase activator NlpD
MQEVPSSGNVKVNLRVYQNEDGTIVELRAINFDNSIYTLLLNLDLENMKADHDIPFIATLGPKMKQEIVLLQIKRADEKKPFYYKNLFWTIKIGNFTGEVIHDGVYFFPWQKGKTFFITNAYNGIGAHKVNFAYGLDFNLPEGTKVLAARDGLVVSTEDGFTKGGDDPSLGDKANYVYIQHSDGTIGRYLHFKYKSITVKTGDKILEGEVIGSSGNVGWSMGPHLHFDVVKIDSNGIMQTIPIKLQSSNGKSFDPELGMELKK